MRFADYCANYFGEEEGKCKGYPGHEIAEMALVRLYEITGEHKYLQLSEFFINERGKKPYYFELEEMERATYEKRKFEPGKEDLKFQYHQAHLPVREQSQAHGHSVRAVYLYAGMADVARITNDQELEEACERLWNSMIKEKMYITGGIGATHMGEAFSFPYDLPNDTAYSETCAAIGLVFFARRMLQLQMDSKYADVMELALYNTVLSGMALDGKSFFYVNPLEVLPEACHKDERKFHVKSVRQKWFGCACCPPNIARMLSSVAAYAYTENEDTLFTHLYMGSILTKKVRDQEINLKISTNMPWSGAVEVEVEAQNVECTLAFRIPSWGKNYHLKYCVNGIEKKEATIKKGYLYLKEYWNTGDIITLDFEMCPRFIKANPKVREDIGKVALMRGPFVYCLEEKDNDSNLHLCQLDLEKYGAETVTSYEINEMGHKQIMLEVQGYRFGITEGELYEEVGVEKKESATLKFVPYYSWNNRGEGEMLVWVRK